MGGVKARAGGGSVSFKKVQPRNGELADVEKDFEVMMNVWKVSRSQQEG